MRAILALFLTTAIVWPLAQADANAQTTNAHAFAKMQDKVGYAIGTQLGRNFKRSHFDVNLKELVHGIQDILDGREPKLTEQEAQQAIGDYQAQKYREIGEQNLRSGEAFFAEHKNKPGYHTHTVTLPDGKTADLMYKIITEGNGEIPKATDLVTVNYRGKVLNGDEYDSSFKRHHPATFVVNTVVNGWAQALQIMPVGSKWQIYLPPTLAYGPRPMPGITPNATLDLEVELLKVEPPPQPKPVTSDIIRVPSAEEMKAGAKIEVLKPEDVEKLTNQQTNAAKAKP